jgi:hypothetical protein
MFLVERLFECFENDTPAQALHISYSFLCKPLN